MAAPAEREGPLEQCAADPAALGRRVDEELRQLDVTVALDRPGIAEDAAITALGEPGLARRVRQVAEDRPVAQAEAFDGRLGRILRPEEPVPAEVVPQRPDEDVDERAPCRRE